MKIRTARRPRTQVPHRTRPEHKERHPVHVTLRAKRRLPSLRNQVVFAGLRIALAKSSHSWFRVVHFSIQADHVHLLLEARDKSSLSRGIWGLTIRFARSINRSLGRTGRVFSDRYHARALKTPREVRCGLVYVLMNFKKHLRVTRDDVDMMSSAPWFDGWQNHPRTGASSSDPPVEPPQTWLARIGWRRHGLLRPIERPRD